MIKKKSSIAYLILGSIFFANIATATGLVEYPTGDIVNLTDAKAILATPTLGLLSAYQLEEVTGSTSASNFNITKYIENTEANSLESIDYNVTFDNALGDDSTTVVKYYQWTTDSSTKNLVLSEVNYDDSYDITASSSSNIRIDGNSEGSNITSSFLGVSVTDSNVNGGAVFNDTASYGGETIDITGDFIANSAISTKSSTSDKGAGGAIYNNDDATLGAITGDFIGNYAQAVYYAFGGAIYNGDDVTITSITGDFIGNYTVSNQARGGAIYNNGASIGTINSDFINNYSYGTYANGGAIYNDSTTITSIKGDFIENHSVTGGAIYNYDKSKIGEIVGDFIGNYATNKGGAIYNTTGCTITKIAGDFVSNYSLVSGGAIYNYTSSTISEIDGDFITNYTTDSGGAIYNDSTSNIYNVSSNFLANYILSDSLEGGAVYNDGNMSFLASDKSIEFTGNRSIANGIVTSNAIYNTGTVDFNAFDNNTISVNDAINGTTGTAVMNINNATLDTYQATSYSSVEFNNSVSYQNINVENGTLTLGSFEGVTLEGMGVESLDGSSDLVVDGSIAALSNSTIQVNSGATLNISTDANLNSVELTNSTITVSGDSTLTFEAFSSLNLTDSDSSLIFDDQSIVIVDFGDYLGDIVEYALLTIDDSTNLDNVYQYLTENLEYESNFNEVDIDLTMVGNSIYLNGSISVPESSTYAMIFGSLALVVAMYRRRKN